VVIIGFTPMTLLTAATRTAIAREAAARIADTLRTSVGARGAASLALSGGSTPRDTYELLAAAKGIDWAKVDVFWVDERAVPPTHERSNFFMAYSALIARVGLDASRVWRMGADRPDINAAAIDYERLLRERIERDSAGVPALDVVVLGIGTDGHTASLFPGEATVELTVPLVASVPARGAREARLTVTAPILEHARNVFVLVAGAEKRTAVARVLAAEGDVRETPGRIIGKCLGSVTWIMDCAAAPEGA
jgi:6-phosphogluconolactonase